MFYLELKTIEGDDVLIFSMLGIDGEEISGSGFEICREKLDLGPWRMKQSEVSLKGLWSVFQGPWQRITDHQASAGKEGGE